MAANGREPWEIPQALWSSIVQLSGLVAFVWEVAVDTRDRGWIVAAAMAMIGGPAAVRVQARRVRRLLEMERPDDEERR